MESKAVPCINNTTFSLKYFKVFVESADWLESSAVRVLGELDKLSDNFVCRYFFS